MTSRAELRPSETRSPEGEPPAKAPQSFAQNLRLVWSFRRYAAPFLLPAIGLLLLAFLQADLGTTAASGTNQLLSRIGPGSVEAASAPAATKTSPPPPQESERKLTPAGWFFQRFGKNAGAFRLAVLIVTLLILALVIRLVSEQIRGIINAKFRYRVQQDLVRAMTRELADGRGKRDPGNSTQIFLSDSNGLSSLLHLGLSRSGGEPADDFPLRVQTLEDSQR